MRPADHDQAVEAARQWIAEHGRYPQQNEWEHWAPGRPTTRTIKRRWGWEELMRAARGAGARSPKLEARRQLRLELLLTLRAPVRDLAAGLSNGSAAEVRFALLVPADDSRPIALRELGEGGTGSAKPTTSSPEAERLRDLFRHTGRGGG